MAVYYHEGKFPPESLDWQRIIGPLADATEAIARYDSFLGIIPDADILIAPLMAQEAVTSSRIEGTKATVGDVLAYEAGSSELDPARRNDIMEVINYQQAVTVAEEMLGDVPLSGRVLRSAHRVLLSGVRGSTNLRESTESSRIGLGGPTTFPKRATCLPLRKRSRTRWRNGSVS